MYMVPEMQKSRIVLKNFKKIRLDWAPIQLYLGGFGPKKALVALWEVRGAMFFCLLKKRKALIH